VEHLPELVKENFKNWKDGARPFQLTCMGAQILSQDVLLHAATGAGKTGIAAGPHLLPSNKGKVMLVVSPLLSLHEEQVTTFQEEFSLKAMAMNSSSGGCKKETMAISLQQCQSQKKRSLIPGNRQWGVADSHSVPRNVAILAVH
jgi:superfamily II DNA helicase RecQ